MEKVLIVCLEPLKATMTTEAVYNFLKTQNRPYSVNDILSNLDKEKHSKGAIQKSLDKLVDKHKVFVKTSGKQKVYCITQESKQTLEELKRMERELQTHASEQLKKLQDLENEVKSQEVALGSLKCSISLEEAEKELERLKENNGKLSSKLEELMESTTTSTEDISEIKKKAENNLNTYNREYNKRKRICNDILECILENYPGSKNQLYAEIGIEPV